MALSTSEWVADNLSTSSVGGASGARLVFAPASGPGFGAWLVEARTRLWSLAGGGAIGSLSGYGPARSLCPEEGMNVNMP